MSLIFPFIPSFDRYTLHFRNTREISRIKILEQRRLPRSIPPDNPQNLALLHVKRHIFERSRTLQKEERDGIA